MIHNQNIDGTGDRRRRAINKQQANNPFYKERKRHEQERLAKENASWEVGRISTAALRFDNAGDADLLSKEILIKVPLFHRVLSCLDPNGRECKVLMIKAPEGDQRKLKNLVRQLCAFFRLDGAAFMEAGHAQMLTPDGAAAGDLGEVDPADYKLLASRLLGDGSKVVDEGGENWTWARISGYNDAMFVYGTYNTLEDPESDRYCQMVQYRLEEREKREQAR